MFDTAVVLHFASIVIAMALTSFGVGIGSGRASISAIRAINIAPSTKNDVFRLTIISLALIETGGILGIIVAILLFYQSTDVVNLLPISIAELGIGFSIGLSGLIVGLVSEIPASQALLSLTRQPFFGGKILNLMLLTQSIIQTPVVFGFLIALLIKTQLGSLETLDNALRLFVAGFAMGFGSIGPAIGLARFAKASLEAIAINRNSYFTVLPFSFISQAIIETPIIFVMLISMLLVIQPLTSNSDPAAIFACIAAGIGIAIATFSPGLNSARVAQSAALQIAKNPEQAASVSKVSILGQGLIDTAAIYGLLVCLLLLLLK